MSLIIQSLQTFFLNTSFKCRYSPSRQWSVMSNDKQYQTLHSFISGNGLKYFGWGHPSQLPSWSDLGLKLKSYLELFCNYRFLLQHKNSLPAVMSTAIGKFHETEGDFRHIKRMFYKKKNSFDFNPLHEFSLKIMHRFFPLSFQLRLDLDLDHT